MDKAASRIRLPVICITIQRTLSAVKVRYFIGGKECFKIFYPRFFAWVNLFLLNHLHVKR